MIPYLFVCLVIGVFFSIIWSSNSFLNVMIKSALILWTISTFFMILIVLFPDIAVARKW